MNVKQLVRMPDGIQYVRGSSRLDETGTLRYTNFTNDDGQRFMRTVGPDSDSWLVILPAWYEDWPSRLAHFFKNHS